jgi:hypothetical protein
VWDLNVHAKLVLVNLPLDDLADRVLVLDATKPREPALFSSDSDVGPGIYSGTPPMVPAHGPSPDESMARLLLEQSLGAGHAALERYDGDLGEHFGTPLARAAVASLVGTPAESAIRIALQTEAIEIGTPDVATRIVGLSSGGRHVINERYCAEHPLLLSGALVHELLASQPASSNSEEVLLHGVLAMIHLVQVDRNPSLAHLGTELSRRANSLAVSLINSRNLGSPRFRLRAPSGGGTIPGGVPGMQTPDFWSIPFTRSDSSEPVPENARNVLEHFVRASFAQGLEYNQAGVDWFDDHRSTSWLPPTRLLRVVTTLGLLSVDDIARTIGWSVPMTLEAFDLQEPSSFFA